MQLLNNADGRNVMKYYAATSEKQRGGLMSNCTSKNTLLLVEDKCQIRFIFLGPSRFLKLNVGELSQNVKQENLV